MTIGPEPMMRMFLMSVRLGTAMLYDGTDSKSTRDNLLF